MADTVQMTDDSIVGVDTLHLEQASVFTDCNLETLQELAICSQIVVNDQVEMVKNNSAFGHDDYYYVIEGQFPCLLAGSEIIAKTGEWLTDISMRPDSNSLDSIATGDLRLLHVSSDKLQSCSMSTQAYFYRSISNRLIANQH